MTTSGPSGDMPMINIQRPSYASLLLQLTIPNLADAEAPPTPIGTATGMLVRVHDQIWLLTAGHVLTGRHSVTGALCSQKTGQVPQHVNVRLPHPSAYWVHMWSKQPLYNESGERRWVEHPAGRQVDVAALPLTQESLIGNATKREPESTWTVFKTENQMLPDLVSPLEALFAPLGPISLDVGERLTVVGYPFGLTGGAGLAIWNFGHIATELQFDHDGLPMYLLDARTRDGQSGAPVYFHSRSGVFPTHGGVGSGLGANLLRFMGVYSGRVNEESDLGRVFRPDAVRALFEAV